MKIYDTFLFDSEFQMLEHHLAEVYDHVDGIVLVEAGQTFQGASKPLHFSQHRELFQWASPKLRHIALPSLPGDSPWGREAFQRNLVLLGLRDAQPEDIVLLLDVDEVPSRSVLDKLRNEGLSQPHRLLMTRHYGQLDQLSPRSACCPSSIDPFPCAVPHLHPENWDSLGPQWWCMPGVAVRMMDLKGDEAQVLPPRTAHDLRRSTQFAPRLAHAGRHLNSIMAAEALANKLTHVSHTELAQSRALSPQHLRRAAKYNVHSRGWWYTEKPEGQLPEDLVRLQKRIDSPAPANRLRPLMRRLVRTWSWMRLSPHLPERCVQTVDRMFEALVPVLSLPLLCADGIRSLASWWLQWDGTEPSGTH